MKIAKIIAALGVIAMTAVLIYGFTAGDFGSDGGEILRNPWGIVSLVDLYTGFILFSAWIVYREKSIVARCRVGGADDGAGILHRQPVRLHRFTNQPERLEEILDG